MDSFESQDQLRFWNWSRDRIGRAVWRVNRYCLIQSGIALRLLLVGILYCNPYARMPLVWFCVISWIIFDPRFLVDAGDLAVSLARVSGGE